VLNTKCIEKDNHRWGVCEQICADCGVKDLITVNLCEDNREYFCYTCNRNKQVA